VYRSGDQVNDATNGRLMGAAPTGTCAVAGGARLRARIADRIGTSTLSAAGDAAI
jgi:hypothetical protein